MSSAWEQMLLSMEPKYDELVQLIESPNDFKAEARCGTNNTWTVEISLNGPLGSKKSLNKRLDWATEQLNSWKLVSKINRQEWKFYNQAQAEKFLTLYHLRWK